MERTDLDITSNQREKLNLSFVIPTIFKISGHLSKFSLTSPMLIQLYWGKKSTLQLVPEELLIVKAQVNNTKFGNPHDIVKLTTVFVETHLKLIKATDSHKVMYFWNILALFF